MYFINEKHKNNFNQLMDLYDLDSGKNSHYEASLYIASVPDIYKCFKNIEEIDTSISPLWELCDFDQEKQKWEIAVGGLTGSTCKMIEFGLSLYNGYPINLNDVLGTVSLREYVLVLIQAMEIRAPHWIK